MAKLTNEQRKALHIVSKSVRIGYPRVWNPEVNQLSGKEEYSLQIRWFKDNPDHMAQVKRLVELKALAAKAFWGDDWEKTQRQANDSRNTRFLMESDDGSYYYVNVKRQKGDGAPKIVDRDKTKALSESDGKIYGGAVCNVVWEMWCYSKNAKGWSGTLLGLQFVEDGEPFSGSSQAKDDDFEDLSDAGSDDLIL